MSLIFQDKPTCSSVYARWVLLVRHQTHVIREQGYRITSPKFSKTVLSVSHNGAIQTTLLLDKLIWATDYQPWRFPKSPHSGQCAREGALTHNLKKTLQRTNVKPSKKQKLNDEWCCVKPKDREAMWLYLDEGIMAGMTAFNDFILTMLCSSSCEEKRREKWMFDKTRSQDWWSAAGACTVCKQGTHEARAMPLLWWLFRII